MTWWLQGGIDRLVRATTAPGDDLREYTAAYDECLWRIATSGSEELRPLVANAWLEPYSDLPIPLAVVACRLFAVMVREGDPDRFAAINFVAAHCSTGEEEGALEGVHTSAPPPWRRVAEPSPDEE